MMTLFARRSALALALAMAAGLAASPAFSADAGKKDTVVANVNGADVRLSALADFARQMGPDGAKAPYEMLLEVAINNQLVYEQAKKEKLDADPEVKAALKKIEMQILTQAYMQKKVKPSIGDAAVKARYDQLVKDFVPAEEVRARHILVETEEAARSIIAELTRGVDFAELAKTRSKDQAPGGDLGYFTKGDMVPEFANAAFAMRPGELSKTPVKSQFGYHVIKVEDKRMSSIPPFDKAKPMVAQEIASGIQNKLVGDLREKAKIKRFTPDGAPMGEAPRN
ncbi:peptidylprolyl isomerase [Magnetospirillum sp. SS-4]|uniref:peptidylprolyl isomerase n=1 Tax=Magnetospirillum sp. SS-4 TaxID=2681465 RepID=UPI00137E1014|nr:peptidylprolyl isomerase [Magnetospirillum sp. SS-4]CAA7626757.1 Parvulin-like peptidyl-prolyl isomerase [Magnetospirillum sp. SS-4]